MHICALRTDKVGLPTRPDNPVRFDPIETTKREWSIGTRILECARRYTDASRSRLMSSAKRRAALSTLHTSLSGCDSVQNREPCLSKIKPLVGR